LTERRAVFFSRGALFGFAFLTRSLRAGRGFRTADFAAERFFFFDLAIVSVLSATSNRLARRK